MLLGSRTHRNVMRRSIEIYPFIGAEKDIYEYSSALSAVTFTSITIKAVDMSFEKA